MKIDYFYRKSPKIQEELERLKVLKGVIELLPEFPHIEENLRRESLLKSSLFSARIEGNKLRLEELNYLSLQKSTKDIEKIEVANILKALNWLNLTNSPSKLSLKLIYKLHQLVLTNLSSEAGHFRHELSAIFNQADIAIYVAPPANQVSDLIKKLIKRNNSSKEAGPIKAAIAHFTFEKIHPFLDGNGRVGRLISVLILKNSGFDYHGLVSLEEYLEKNRQEYYELLAGSKKDITEFVEFFLEGLRVQAEKTVERLKETKRELPEDSLLPRRREILEIIKDHKIVAFDFLKRRFTKIPNSSLHYDLTKLLKAGFIKKLGTTRGTLYAPKP